MHSVITCNAMQSMSHAALSNVGPAPIIDGDNVHAVTYDDGDREKLDLTKERFKLLPPKVTKSAAKRSRLGRAATKPPTPAAAALPDGLEDSDVDMSEEADNDSDDDFGAASVGGASSSESESLAAESASDMECSEEDVPAKSAPKQAVKRASAAASTPTANKKARKQKADSRSGSPSENCAPNGGTAGKRQEERDNDACCCDTSAA